MFYGFVLLAWERSCRHLSPPLRWLLIVAQDECSPISMFMERLDLSRRLLALPNPRGMFCFLHARRLPLAMRIHMCRNYVSQAIDQRIPLQFEGRGNAVLVVFAIHVIFTCPGSGGLGHESYRHRVDSQHVIMQCHEDNRSLWRDDILVSNAKKSTI